MTYFSRPRNHCGFTLLEMLLALVIFTMVSIGGWQILTTITNARDVQTRHEQRLTELDYTMLVLKQDFRQLVDRGRRVDGKVTTNSLFTADGMHNSDSQGISFVRAGWQNAEYRLPRSNLQRVYYRLKENQLQRAYDQVLDNPTNDEAEFKVLLTGVENLSFRFYYGNQWRDQLKQNQLPKAVEIQLSLTREGQINRRFILPSSWKATDGEV